jgi:hypothetical protein
MHILKTKRSFRLEFKRQLRFAISAAIGFTIAFSWRNAIFAFFRDEVSRLLEVDPRHYLTETYAAIVITLLGVLLILLTSKLLRE